MGAIVQVADHMDDGSLLIVVGITCLCIILNDTPVQCVLQKCGNQFVPASSGLFSDGIDPAHDVLSDANGKSSVTIITCWTLQFYNQIIFFHNILLAPHRGWGCSVCVKILHQLYYTRNIGCCVIVLCYK